MENKLSLSELNFLIKDALIDAFPATVWVVAEVSELKENRSGHCYLELIEKEQGADTIVARSRATIWSYTFRMLKPYFETSTGKIFSSGIKVLVQATVEYHPAYGLSLNIKDIDPAYTIGDLVKNRNEIIQRLKAEGIFDMNKGLQLPLVPQNIAVISSATAAGYQDFVTQLEANGFGIKFHHKLFEAYMQGADSVPSIINALERIYQFDDFFDAVVIIRGGGAQADLNSFDNYDLAVNISQFPLPVITGIGHEKDDTIVDLVAHTRLKTPTAVAEFLINGAGLFVEKLEELEIRVINLSQTIIKENFLVLENAVSKINSLGNYFLLQKRNDLFSVSQKLKNQTNSFVTAKRQELFTTKNTLWGNVKLFDSEQTNQLKLLSYELANNVKTGLSNKKISLEAMKHDLVLTTHSFMSKKQDIQNLHKKTIDLLDPKNVLKRGYSLTLKDGEIIKSAKKLKKDDLIKTRFYDGSVESKITKN